MTAPTSPAQLILNPVALIRDIARWLSGPRDGWKFETVFGGSNRPVRCLRGTPIQNLSRGRMTITPFTHPAVGR